MKRIAVLAVALLFVFSSMAYAHPPSDIKIAFDPGTKMLKAVIMHDVSNPASHYIKTVDIGLNGKEIISQSISRQDNDESQTVSCLIPDARGGDVISVEAYCNISGKLKKEATVQAGK